jgi:hypothetical protein
MINQDHTKHGTTTVFWMGAKIDEHVRWWNSRLKTWIHITLNGLSWTISSSRFFVCNHSIFKRVVNHQKRGTWQEIYGTTQTGGVVRDVLPRGWPLDPIWVQSLQSGLIFAMNFLRQKVVIWFSWDNKRAQLLLEVVTPFLNLSPSWNWIHLVMNNMMTKEGGVRVSSEWSTNQSVKLLRVYEVLHVTRIIYTIADHKGLACLRRLYTWVIS